MTRRTANLIGWALIAVVTAVCFGLDAMRAQYIYFNGFVIFTLVASTVLVVANVYLAKRADNQTEQEQEPRSGR
jgi:Kef-type K+ transport system membrane component KefB